MFRFSLIAATLRRGAVAAVALTVLASCKQDPKDELKIGLTIWPPNEMAYLAQDLGLFEGANIRLIEDGTPSEYVSAFSSGAFDGAVATLGTALHVLSAMPDHRIVLLVSYSSGGDALVAHQHIQVPTDLKRKRVGYEPLALGTYLLTRFLHIRGMKIDDINPVPLDMSQHLTAFETQEVDAVVSFEPTVSALVEAGGHVLLDSRELPGEIMDVLIVHESVLVKKRALLSTFLEGWFQALDFHETKLEQAALKSDARNHFGAKAYTKAFGQVVMLNRETNLSLMSPDNPTLAATVRMHSEFLRRLGLIGSGIHLAALVDATLLGDPTSRDESFGTKSSTPALSERQ